MSNTFITSDSHFNHAKICQFTNNDGTKVRPWDNIEEMDEAMTANWNAVVKPGDKVYHLGDVAMTRRGLDVLSRLNGKKVLVKGNHDVEKLSVYSQYFYDVRGSHQLAGFLLTHIPIHPASIERWKGNFHGHLHSNRVMLDNTIDPRYLCLCVEHTNFAPIALEEAKARFQAQQA